LVDFGLMAVGGRTRTVVHTRGKVAGAYGWMAPEFFEDDDEIVPEGCCLRKTMAGDIFAFGRVLLAVRQWHREVGADVNTIIYSYVQS
jgi:hypothetical protein